MYRILIVEDDAVIREALREHLSAWGYEVGAVEDFDRVMDEVAAFSPQLILLDLKLPGFNGYYWCREIRRVSTLPIIFITSAGDNLTAVTAMNMGADDLIAKPFDLALLMAKVEALLRRSYGFASASPIMTHGGLSYLSAQASLQYDGKTAELTRNENRIMQTLMENRGKIVSREQLMTRLWETESFVDENTLTVNVGRLRRKLEELGLPELIETRKGQGYLVAAP